MSYICKIYLTDVIVKGFCPLKNKARNHPLKNQPAEAGAFLGGAVHDAWSEALECVQLAAAFAPVSSLAGRGSRSNEIESKQGVRDPEIPASKLAAEKAAASCTHSKALLRMLVEKCSLARLSLLQAMDFLHFLMSITVTAAVQASMRQHFDVNCIGSDSHSAGFCLPD
ncbi:MAG: hypothetical protein ACLQVL_02175 [Terriglobia bacterium]